MSDPFTEARHIVDKSSIDFLLIKLGKLEAEKKKVLRLVFGACGCSFLLGFSIAMWIMQ